MPARFQSVRRNLATVLAAGGALVLSSGLALVVSATPAQADQNKDVIVCHAQGNDTFKEIPVSPSGALDGHLNHRSSPTATWQVGSWWNGQWHPTGSPRPDVISDYTDDQGVFHQLDGTPEQVAALCAGPVSAGPVAVTPAVAFTDPTCAGVDAGWAGQALTGVSYAVTSGTVAAGQDVTVTAALAEGYALAQGATSTFSHTFADPQCQQDPGTQDPGTQDPGTQDPGTQDPGTQDPGTQGPGTEAPGAQEPGTSGQTVAPVAEQPKGGSSKHHAVVQAPAAPQQAAAPTGNVVTPTVVHAGLAGLPTAASGASTRGLGLALSSGGALLLLGAGWLGFGQRRRDAGTC